MSKLASPSTSRQPSPSLLGESSATVSLPTKVTADHLQRLAIVYVRQSTPQQVLEHRESTARQYALAQRAVMLGWSRERVEVIDEDQGQSGAASAARHGFQRLLSQVSDDAVGIVLGLEMSRLARSGKDWHALLELCAIYRTLLGDADGVYDPSDYNDRLLLGLKGTMSEAELHILKSRMYRGLCNKAERGEALNHPPIGYVRSAAGDYVLDPDAQVQAVVRSVFERFARWGSISGLLKSLVHDQVLIPVRPHGGPQRGELQWRRPNRVTLLNMIHHPIYAGAYRWGHRDVDPRKKVAGRPGSGRTLRSYDQCRVLIPDRFEAYLTWEQFEQNQQTLRENSQKGKFHAAPGRGASLLAGLLQCGRCGRSMMVAYSCQRLRYVCQRGAVDYGEPLCQSLSGSELDQAVGQLLLKALQPASLALSLAAAEDLTRQRRDTHLQWRRRLERMEYDVELARRQYAAVDPDHRLVAQELERRWEENLREQERLRREHRVFEQAQPRELTSADRAQIESLSGHLEALWHDVNTTPEDRQVIARTLLDRLVVNVEGDSEHVEVEVRWSGGFVSRLVVARPVQTYDRLSNYAALLARVKELKSAGRTHEQIGEELAREGYHPAKRAKKFSRAMITRLLRRERERAGTQTPCARDRSWLGRDEWWLADLALHLQMPVATLHRWRRVGWVRSRKVAEAGGLWALYADARELTRLRKLRAYRRGWGETRIPQELTTPASADR